MSIRSTIVTAAALVALGGAGAAQAPTAMAATPSCGHACVDLFNPAFGTPLHQVLILEVLNGRPSVGQPITLARAGNSNETEDFVESFQGTVSDFFAAGLVSAGVDALYANRPAFEFEYSPFGVDSGLCMGVGTRPGSLTPVTLQPCGVSAKTVWIAASDLTNNSSAALINGATDTNFAHPFALTGVSTGLPLVTFPLISTNNVLANQGWGAAFGVLP